MPFSDKFNSVTELMRHKQEGRDYRVDVREVPGSTIAVVAPHAGLIDLNTGDMAARVAGDDYNLYTFSGIAPGDNMGEMHVTSIHFDEPRCLEMLKKADVTVTIHGCKGDEPAVYLSGMDTKLEGKLKDAFNAAGFKASIDGHGYQTGTKPENVCNKNRRGQGVQIEFTRAIRADAELSAKAARVVRETLKNYTP